MATAAVKKNTYKVKVTFEGGKQVVFRDVYVSDFATFTLGDDYHLTTGNMKLWKRKGNVILGEEVPYKSLIVLAQRK